MKTKNIYNQLLGCHAAQLDETGMFVFLSSGSYYSGNHRSVAKAMKTNDTAAIRAAAEAMSGFILPDRAVLVPIPSHLGYATYTLQLANQIAEATGLEVANVLVGNERNMLYDMKQKGKALANDYLGLRLTEDIPSDRQVYFVDNVIDTGYTARQAFNVVGRGSMIVYAHTYRFMDNIKQLP